MSVKKKKIEGDKTDGRVPNRRISSSKYTIKQVRTFKGGRIG